MSDIKIRALMSKIGLDGHDRGIRIVTSFLREAGVEVVFIGRFQTSSSIVNTALQEDVDLIGISSLTGEYSTLIPELLQLLKEKKMDQIPVVIGGIIPKADCEKLKKAGIKEVFPAGSSVTSIVDYMIAAGQEYQKIKGDI
ncbi:MAG TPA: methylmalonyl-CoA mutase [Desulfobacteraceae bacterium]|nr:methylmalonyl-CoA mutase [Desulfobacteraceae bacterium]